MLAELIREGVDVFRLNMAHGGPEQGQIRLDRIRKVSAELGITVGALADLAGPKIRLGELPNGQYECDPEIPVRFVRGNSTTQPNTFTTTYESLIDELEVGNRIMLADGTVALEVLEKNPDDVLCRVLLSGTVRSRQGVNLPGAKLSVKTLQPVDIENAIWASRAGIDFLGMSFVRSAKDIHELRNILLESVGGDSEKIPHILAKIEKPEALERIDEILDAADAIMVARGDLGVEVDIARIAAVQKRIIGKCREKNKPVIVATQMLESMHHLTLPTRAEATDVANAILDGTDACMLSGETAVGEHPVLTVKMMHRIAVETEKIMQFRDQSEFRVSRGNSNGPAEAGNPQSEFPEADLPEPNGITDAVCAAAVDLADRIGAALLLVTSHSGRTARGLSGQRSATLTIGMSGSERALRRMNLYWGVIPVRNAPQGNREKLEQVVASGKQAGYLKTGDRVVLVCGLENEPQMQNILYVHVVE